MEEKLKVTPCIPGVLPGGLNRTQFFDGMFLTQKDLEREQNFWTMKRRMTNRALGSGVVWGLRLQWDKVKRRFHLSPGYALDCCGNDLIVECETEFSERSLVDLSDPMVRAIMSGQLPNSDRCPRPISEDELGKAGVILQYMECPEEPRPVHQDACSTNVTRCEYASIRETTRILLVPPPNAAKPSPIDNFCADLQVLKQECEELGVECTLFDTTVPATATQLKARIRIQEQPVSGAPPLGAELRPDLNLDNQPVSTLLDMTNDPARLRIWFEPDPGYVFLQGSVTDRDGVVKNLTPFGLDLMEIELGTGGANVEYVINDLVVAPMFSNGVHQTASMLLNLTPGTANAEITASVTTNSVEAIEEPAACAELINPGLIFNGDPLCISRTLALSALCGWFRGLVVPMENNVIGGRQQLAWLICLVSWRLLFKANLEADTDARLTELLNKLFREWCSGFVYPGPICCEQHHGVYLGSVTLSRKGSIVHFDPWDYRRHVVTGPLLNHWRGQLGLAPLDVVGARMAQWICCLSNSQSLPLAQQANPVANSYIPITDSGVGLFYGADYDAYLSAHGLVSVGEPFAMDTSAFIKMITTSMLHDDPAINAANNRGRRIYSVNGAGNVYLLVPAPARIIRPPSGSRSRNELVSAVENMTAELRPMARHVVSDFMLEFSNDIELNSLRVPAGNDYFQPFVKALDDAGVKSVADYLAMGPEAAVKRALPYATAAGIEEDEIAYIAAEDVYEVAETMLKKTAKPLLDSAKDTATPFVRERLLDDKLLNEVRKSAATNLKRNHLTKTEVTNVAEKVIAMG